MKNLVLLTTFVLCLWVTTVASDNVTTKTEWTPVDHDEAKVIIVNGTVNGTEVKGDESTAAKHIPFQWPRIAYKRVYRNCRKCCKGYRYDSRTKRCIEDPVNIIVSTHPDHTSASVLTVSTNMEITAMTLMNASAESITVLILTGVLTHMDPTTALAPMGFEFMETGATGCTED
ncbi:Hypothetical predicted protein [Octopus vulgaris]|uniref:Uncharacterized protein n=1 Tax=Octopus vulgaris TaxID=6645 RepID=A0AA36FQX5_OCTVU|nr:Hypothetical predicted protein [Octopus vulgaris]